MIRRILLAACGAAVIVVSSGAAGPAFVDITAKAGIRFQHFSGATGKKLMPESFGSGAVFFDADGDGWQDILLVNGSRIPGEPGKITYSSLYRNRGDGTFVDITKGSGLDVETGSTRDIRERAVAIVAIQAQGRALLRVPGPVHAIDEQDVLPAVAVVVEEGAAGTKGLGQQRAPIGAVVVAERQSGRSRDVDELKPRAGRR